MKADELLWHHRYMSHWLLQRHIDRLFWCWFYGHFHQNGVASQGHFRMAIHHRDIYCNILLLFHGRIEIVHSYGLHCSGLFCHSGPTHGQLLYPVTYVILYNACFCFFVLHMLLRHHICLKIFLPKRNSTGFVFSWYFFQNFHLKHKWRIPNHKMIV